MVLIPLLSMAAEADDGPTLWVRELTAATLQPSGIIADVAAEVRSPVLRYGGAVFNDTFVGAGARVAASPAHLDTALRLSVQPIDVLPITVEAVRTTYWRSPFGLLPLGALGASSSDDRKPLYRDDLGFAGHAWAIVLSPTLQARAGPVVAFSNFTVTWIRIRPVDPAERWVFEPFRGMVVGYDDRLLEHTSAVLLEPLDGEERALLRVGPVLRGKGSRETGDATLTLGGLLQWRPGKGEHGPTLAAIASGYLRDGDYLGPIPNVILALTFGAEVPLAP